MHMISPKSWGILGSKKLYPDIYGYGNSCIWQDTDFTTVSPLSAALHTKGTSEVRVHRKNNKDILQPDLIP